MRVHHLNCATMCPFGGRLVTGPRGGPARLVCHCLLIETEGGLVLVDTGFGVHDVEHPEDTPLPLRTFSRPRFSRAETALHQIRQLGLDPSDVRHIVPTHLDLDHSGGLPDFPEAKVHIHAQELAAALHPKNALEGARYPRKNWAHGPHWIQYETVGEPWFGFDAVRQLAGLPPEILLVPLFGHTRGHCGVAVSTEHGWLLHAGDAYFYDLEMRPERPYCSPGLSIFQGLAQVDGRARLANQGRLRDLVRDHGEEVTVFCAHDAAELDRFG